MSRNHLLPTRAQVLVLCLLLAWVVPAGSAAAAPSEPTISPSSGDRDLRDNDADVDFGGTVEAGWSYRAGGETSGQAWVEFRDAGGDHLVSDDVTQVVSVNASGTIAGSVALNTSHGPRAEAKTVRLAVRVTSGGEVSVGRSSDLRIDRERPHIVGYSVIAPDVIQVTFSEEVRSASGDDRRDWTVDDPDATVQQVRQPDDGDLRIRFLDLVSDLPEDATPLVAYTQALFNSPYVDFAGRTLTAENNPSRADDGIPPPVPTFVTIDGVAPSSGVLVRGADRPEIVAGNLRAGDTIELWRDGLVDSTRDLDRGAPDILLASEVVPDGANQVTIRASDYARALTPDEDHTLFLRAVDGSGRDSVGSTRYRVDQSGPIATSAAGDGRFVTVRFSEPITGTDRAADWKVDAGGPVESVSGSGDYRVIRTASNATGRITWTAPTADGVTPYQDEHGNRLVAVDLAIDAPGQLRVSDASTTEGSPLGFVVTVARPSGDDSDYSVAYATEDGTATAGEDYTAASGRLTFSNGSTTKTVPVPTSADDAAEASETMTLRLSNPEAGARLPSPATATGTILEPGAAGLSILDTRAHEGATARAVVQLAKPATKDVTVRWRTADGTAKAGSDYTAGSGTLRIAVGSRDGTIAVPLTGDEADEATETFTIELSDPVNATIQRATATISILDGAGVAPGIGRVSGPSRVETSAAISKAFYASADTVVVATAGAYPDALAGAPLAEKHAAPILLTTRERLHPAITQEVKRLGAKTALVLGGPAALSAQVDRDLRAAGVTTIRRLSGQNRFDTARVIAAEVGGDAVYVVEGANADRTRGWPDAVAVSALAAAQHRPILLVERNRLPSETAVALNRLSPDVATIVGGPAAVNDAVRRAVDQRAGTVDRVAGRTRYETSRAVARRAVAAGFDPGNTFFATGDDWPDSLSASPAVARTGGILLLVDSDRLDDSPPAREWLVTHRDGLRSITLIGGVNAISAFVASQIESQSGLKPR